MSAERIVQAMEIVAYANKIGANAIAHGSTGAGNDQVRFDLIFHEIRVDSQILDLRPRPFCFVNVFRAWRFDVLCWP